ncbi:MAG: MscL family protein [Candidatus Omnitrophota bacterium]
MSPINYFKHEFIKFIRSYSVLGVAIGIVMGQAVAKIITSIVEGLVMPFLELILPGQRWQESAIIIGKAHFKIGPVIASLLDFFSVALVIFFLMRYIFKVEPVTSQKLGDKNA